jgi:hypothetical protein
MSPVVVTSICPQSPSAIRLAPGALVFFGGAKVLVFRGSGPLQECWPRSGVMKQVGEDARIAAGYLYYLGAA